MSTLFSQKNGKSPDKEPDFFTEKAFIDNVMNRYLTEAVLQIKQKGLQYLDIDIVYTTENYCFEVWIYPQPVNNTPAKVLRSKETANIKDAVTDVVNKLEAHIQTLQPVGKKHNTTTENKEAPKPTKRQPRTKKVDTEKKTDNNLNPEKE